MMTEIKERRRAELLRQLVELAKNDHRQRVEHCLARWIANTPCTGEDNGVEK